MYILSCDLEEATDITTDTSSICQSSKEWVWLLDIERVMALLIGRSLGGMLMGSALSNEEKESEYWLSNHLFSNGLQVSSCKLGRC